MGASAQSPLLTRLQAILGNETCKQNISLKQVPIALSNKSICFQSSTYFHTAQWNNNIDQEKIQEILTPCMAGALSFLQKWYEESDESKRDKLLRNQLESQASTMEKLGFNPLNSIFGSDSSDDDSSDGEISEKHKPQNAKNKTKKQTRNRKGADFLKFYLYIVIFENCVKVVPLSNVYCIIKSLPALLANAMRIITSSITCIFCSLE